MALMSNNLGEVDTIIGQSDEADIISKKKSPPRESAIPFILTNRGVAIFLFASTIVLGFTIWNSDWAHEKARDGFTLGGLPLFAVYSMAASLLILIVDRAATRPSGFKRESIGGVLVVVLAAVGIGAIFLSIEFVGFVPAIFAMVVTGSLLLGFRPVWITLSVGLVISVALRLLLYALSVNVSDGPLAKLF